MGHATKNQSGELRDAVCKLWFPPQDIFHTLVSTLKNWNDDETFF